MYSESFMVCITRNVPGKECGVGLSNHKGVVVRVRTGEFTIYKPSIQKLFSPQFSGRFKKKIYRSHRSYITMQLISTYN